MSMKVVVVGSTGSVGRHVVQQALDQGHTIIAFARDPGKLGLEHENLTVAQGDVLDPAAVERAVRGQDAVMCIIGAGEQGTVRTEGTKHIVRAMEAAGVGRLICGSALGVGDSRENLSDEWKGIVDGPLRAAYHDHAGQEAHIEQSGLDWTIVRAAAFTDGERTGIYRHGFPPTDKTLAFEISRADVADFLLRQLSEDGYVRKAPGLSY